LTPSSLPPATHASTTPSSPATPAVLDAAYRLGQATLAPVFAAFAELLLAESRRRGFDRLAFLARDGYFLKIVTECIAASSTSPQLIYAHLTRRSTSLAAAGRLQTREIADTASVRAGVTTWGSALASYGIEGDEAAELLTATDTAASAPLPCTAQIAQVVDRDCWRTRIESLARQRRELLVGYLHQIGLANGNGAALVDIGWRATIQHNLARVAATVDGVSCPAGIYLGLWTEGTATPPLGLDCTGLLADQRRHRRLDEAAAWHAAFLLEAICRADEGTTIGYCHADGTVNPVLAGPSSARSAESGSQAVVARIRAGALDGVREWPHAAVTDARQLRQNAQRQLLRIAFFPHPSEIAVASHLVHTESQAPDWSTPLIASDRPNPLLAPRRWLAGLASPWRTGYVRASAGIAGAALFASGEALLVATPPALRATLQRTARRIAGLG
jgi:hypothetical protein